MCVCVCLCVSDLHQQRHGSALVDLQDFSVLGAQQDVAVAQGDGPDGRVVLQEETFRGGRQRRSLDGVRLQTPLEHVVPQLHDAVLPARHEALGWQGRDEASGRDNHDQQTIAWSTSPRQGPRSYLVQGAHGEDGAVVGFDGLDERCVPPDVNVSVGGSGKDQVLGATVAR